MAIAKYGSSWLINGSGSLKPLTLLDGKISSLDGPPWHQLWHEIQEDAVPWKTQKRRTWKARKLRSEGLGVKEVFEVLMEWWSAYIKKVLSNMSWGPSGQVRPGKFMALRPRNLGSIPSYRWILASSQWDSETSEGIKDAPFSGTSKPSQWQWGFSSLRLHLRTCSRYSRMLRYIMTSLSKMAHVSSENGGIPPKSVIFIGKSDDQQVDFFWLLYF